MGHLYFRKPDLQPNRKTVEAELPLSQRPTTRPRATKPPPQRNAGAEAESTQWDLDSPISSFSTLQAFGFHPLDFRGISWPGRWTRELQRLMRKLRGEVPVVAGESALASREPRPSHSPLSSLSGARLPDSRTMARESPTFADSDTAVESGG